MVADDAWDRAVATYNGGVGGFNYSYTPNEIYVNAEPYWWGYTCGNSGSLCQQTNNLQWPSSGQVVIDPASAATEPWLFNGGAGVRPGCYKVVLNRDAKISAPPYATVCGSWEESSSFSVDGGQASQVQGISANSGVEHASGKVGWLISVAISLILATLY